MRLNVYKRSTILEKLSYKLKTLSNSYVLNELKKIRRYYKDNAFEGCHEELKPIVNQLFTGVFSLNMFNSEKTNEAMKSSKDASKRFCLLSLAHMTSKLTRNSKDYPNDVINELRQFLTDIGSKAEEIKNIDVAPMEPFVDSVKSVFNADMVVTDDNYNRLQYVRNTRTLVDSCFNNPHRLGLQDVNEEMYKNRDIEPGEIKRGDIDTEFNKFLRKINGNMFGVDSPRINKTTLDLLNLINGKDEQNRKELEDLNRKIPVEYAYGYKEEIDSQSLVDSISNFRK